MCSRVRLFHILIDDAYSQVPVGLFSIMTVGTNFFTAQFIYMRMQRLFAGRATVLKDRFQIPNHLYHLIHIKLLGFILPDNPSFEKQSEHSQAVAI